MAYRPNYDEFEDYLLNKTYPTSCYANSGKKKNFRRAVEKFKLRDGILHRIVKRGENESYLRVIKDEKEREEIVSGAHAGFGDSIESKALGGHLGFDKTEEKIASRVWWPCIRKDVREYIRTCDRCQRRAPRLQKGSEKLHPVEIPPHPWSQIGVDICSLPTSKDEYTCMVVAVDYFSKWIEAEPLHRKTGEAVANFLYGCICRHGCFDIQINDRGREFVNSVSAELHRLTGVKQKVTSPYHPQANGLVERSNRTIQDMLMKTLSDTLLVEDWPKALPGILFALRTSKHASTKYSPFFLMYGREPKLPIELTEQQFPQYESEEADYLCPDETETVQQEDTCNDKDRLDVSDYDRTIRLRFQQMENIRTKTVDGAMKNIITAQTRQKRLYDKKREGSKLNCGESVLVYNMRRADRKGGKSADSWLGPYDIVRQLPNKTFELANKGVILKNKVSGANLKPYIKRKCSSPVPDEQFFQQPESDVTICGLEPPVSAVFNPTDEIWRKQKCALLQLPSPVNSPHRPFQPHLGKPEETNSIIGDGNCLFRAMSLELTGSQENHNKLRDITVMFMLENHEHFCGYIGMDVPLHLKTSKMESLCTWGTDVEILCLATLLQTVIYVYTKIGNMPAWVAYKPRFYLKSTIPINSQAIYIKNVCSHYERVTKVGAEHSACIEL